MPVLGEDNESSAPIAPTSSGMADYLEALTPPQSSNEPVGMVGFCVECKNVQADKYYENNIFYKQGGIVPCQWCGGVTVVMREDLVNSDAVRSRMDTSRGLGQTIQPSDSD